MKRQELQKPLVQSALVLLAVFLLIGFVAGSNAHSFAGGITSIFKGLFFSVLFAIALTVALLVSIALLIGIFLASIAIYSPETSVAMYHRLRNSLCSILSSLSSGGQKSAENDQNVTETAAVTSIGTVEDVKIKTNTPPVEQINPDHLVELTKNKLVEELSEIDVTVSQLKKEHQNISVAVSELEATLQKLPIDDVSATAEKLEVKQGELQASIAACSEKLDKYSTALQQQNTTLEQQGKQLKIAQDKIENMTSEIEELRSYQEKLTDTQSVEPSAQEESASDDEPRIFAYLEDEQVKKEFAELVAKAVDDNMTYAEIDEFLTASLSKEVDAIIKDHPSLTKEFIRESKKK